MIQAESAAVSITVAVIGLLGVVLGALLKIFSDELKLFLTGRNIRSKDFIGQWKCNWVCEYGAKADQTLDDRVEVTKASGNKFFARGSNEHGTYDMIGSIKNNDIILLSYSGDKLEDALGGVIIMVADKKRRSMEGRWDEYSDEESFRGGSTIWKRDAL